MPRNRSEKKPVGTPGQGGSFTVTTTTLVGQNGGDIIIRGGTPDFVDAALFAAYAAMGDRMMGMAIEKALKVQDDAKE